MVSLHYFKGFSVLRSMSIDESAIIICNMAYKVKKGKMENKSPFYRNGLVQTKEVIAEVGLAGASLVGAGLADAAIADAAISEAVVPTKEAITKEAITKEALAIDNNNETENLEKDYCFVVKKVKKDNITPNNIGEILLSQIPGISSVSALAIMSTFKTLPNLIMRIKEDVACLHGVTYTNSKNQPRKLNKTIIANIIKFLRPE
jgi:ERCC4-type nuclease